MSSAYRKLPARSANWCTIHARVRGDLMQAMLDLTRGQAAQHVSDRLLAALDPASSDFVEWEVQMLRRRARALELAMGATRQAGLSLRQVQRITRKLTDGE